MWTQNVNATKDKHPFPGKGLDLLLETAQHTDFVALGSLATPTGAANTKGQIVLPDLPDGSVWRLSGTAGDVKSKVAETGNTSGTTTWKLKNLNSGSYVAQFDVAYTATDDTYVNAASVTSTVDLPGGTKLQFDCTEVANGASGLSTFYIKFLRVHTNTGLIQAL